MLFSFPLKMLFYKKPSFFSSSLLLCKMRQASSHHCSPRLIIRERKEDMSLETLCPTLRTGLGLVSSLPGQLSDLVWPGVHVHPWARRQSQGTENQASVCPSLLLNSSPRKGQVASHWFQCCEGSIRKNLVSGKLSVSLKDSCFGYGGTWLWLRAMGVGTGVWLGLSGQWV